MKDQEYNHHLIIVKVKNNIVIIKTIIKNVHQKTS
jgi:hypothetical protein